MESVLRTHVASPEKEGEDLKRSLPVGELDPCQAARPPYYRSVCPRGFPPKKKENLRRTRWSPRGARAKECPALSAASHHPSAMAF